MSSFSFGTTQAPTFTGFQNLGTSTTSALNPFGTTAVTSSMFGAAPFGTNTIRPNLFATPSTATTTSAPSAFPGFSLSGSTLPSLSTTLPTFGATLGSMPALGSLTGSLTATPVAAVVPSSVGLGGVDFTAAASTRGIAGSGKSDKAVKDMPLPNEINETIASFRKHVKEQKLLREEIARVSYKPIQKVQEETSALKQLLSVVSSGLQRNAAAIEKLKAASAQDLQNAEVAQRTKDLPPSLQYENRAPTEYFHHLVLDFENQMVTYRQQIESLERHLNSVAHPSALSPQELNIIIRRLHESFVALAAQLQTVHELLQSKKEMFLRFHTQERGERSNIFDRRPESLTSLSRGSNRHSLQIVSTNHKGPAPFSSFPSEAAMAMASALNRTQQTGAVGQSTGLGSSLLPTFSSGGFGSTSFGSPQPSLSLPVDNSKPFQLQKPPSGNKRGKRWTTN